MEAELKRRQRGKSVSLCQEMDAINVFVVDVLKLNVMDVHRSTEMAVQLDNKEINDDNDGNDDGNDGDDQLKTRMKRNYSNGFKLKRRLEASGKNSLRFFEVLGDSRVGCWMTFEMD